MLFALVLLLSAHASHALRRDSREKASAEISRLASEYGTSFVQASACGGVLEGPAGVINYKLEEIITEYETCVWTVVLSKKRVMEVELLEDGFEWTQKIKVFNKDSFISGFQFALDIEKGDRLVHTIDGVTYPVFQIAFTSLHLFRQNTTGFSLLFKGVGEYHDPERYLFKMFDQTGSTGTLTYPEFGNVYPLKEFVSLTIHPEEGKQVALTLDSYERKYPCGNANPNYRVCRNMISTNVLITEINYDNETPLVRLSECRNTNHSNRIYSPFPLVVQYYSSDGWTGSCSGRGKLRLSWKMVEFN